MQTSKYPIYGPLDGCGNCRQDRRKTGQRAQEVNTLMLGCTIYVKNCKGHLLTQKLHGQSWNLVNRTGQLRTKRYPDGKSMGQVWVWKVGSSGSFLGILLVWEGNYIIIHYVRNYVKLPRNEHFPITDFRLLYVIAQVSSCTVQNVLQGQSSCEVVDLRSTTWRHVVNNMISISAKSSADISGITYSWSKGLSLKLRYGSAWKG